LGPFSEFAPAKVNLYLHVIGRRSDGYHLLDSLAVFTAVGDSLSVVDDDGLSLSVTGPFAAGLADETDNLVLRAARALAECAGIRARGKLVLEKNLPVASGIGGGSADAAAALRLLARFWGLTVEVPRKLAVGLGADVPVCLASVPAVMAGIGDVLKPAPPLPRLGIVLVNPRVAVSTSAVFRSRAVGFSDPATLADGAWPDAERLVSALRGTRNDLEASARALVPVIGDVLDTLASADGCLLARMSGSGATCFGIFPSPAMAARIAEAIPRKDWWVWGGGLASG
jgi:4-diphosphocytidyl-2-C-methyl-D-erythritol kinase